MHQHALLAHRAVLAMCGCSCTVQYRSPGWPTYEFDCAKKTKANAQTARLHTRTLFSFKTGTQQWALGESMSRLNLQHNCEALCTRLRRQHAEIEVFCARPCDVLLEIVARPRGRVRRGSQHVPTTISGTKQHSKTCRAAISATLQLDVTLSLRGPERPMPFHFAIRLATDEQRECHVVHLERRGHVMSACALHLPPIQLPSEGPPSVPIGGYQLLQREVNTTWKLTRLCAVARERHAWPLALMENGDTARKQLVGCLRLPWDQVFQR